MKPKASVSRDHATTLQAYTACAVTWRAHQLPIPVPLMVFAYPTTTFISGETPAPIPLGRIQPVSTSARVVKVSKYSQKQIVAIIPLQFVLFADVTVLLFIGAQSRDLADISVPITACADGSYCCGADDALNDACCRVHVGLFVKNARVVSSLASSFLISPSIAISSQLLFPILTPVTLPEPTTPTPNPTSSNTGPIVGGVIGGIAGVTVLALAFWYVILRHKSAQRQDRPPPQKHHEELQGERQDVWQEPEEVSADDIRGELDAGHRVELEGRQGLYV